VVLAAKGQVLVFARGQGAERVVVVVNAGASAAPVPSAAGLEGRFHEWAGDSELELGKGRARIPARTGWVLGALGT